LHVLDDAAAALAGGIFLALDIPSLVHANMIVTETLFTALTFLVFAFLGRRGMTTRLAVIAGIVAGASVLVRPIALYVVVPSAAVIAAERRPGRVVRMLAFTICFLLFPMAWSARNAVRGGGFTVSTITSWSLLFDRAAATLAIGDPGDFGVNLARRRNEFAREAGDPPQATYSNHVIRPIDHFHAERWRCLSSCGTRGRICMHTRWRWRERCSAAARSSFRTSGAYRSGDRRSSSSATRSRRC
jgi:hypothetical protein